MIWAFKSTPIPAIPRPMAAAKIRVKCWQIFTAKIKLIPAISNSSATYARRHKSGIVSPRSCSNARKTGRITAPTPPPPAPPLQKMQACSQRVRIRRNIMSGKNQPALLMRIFGDDLFYPPRIVPALFQKERIQIVQIGLSNVDVPRPPPRQQAKCRAAIRLVWGRGELIG